MRRPPIWTVLATLSGAALLTPIVGIFALRLYDTELIRQTESELIAQAAFVQASFRIAYEDCAIKEGLSLDEVGRPSVRPPEVEISEDGVRRFRPLPVSLRLSDSYLPPSPDPETTSIAPDGCGLFAGNAITPMLREAQEVTLAGIRVVDTNLMIVSSTRTEDVGMMWRTDEAVSALDAEVSRTIRQRISSHPTPPLDSFSRRGGLRVFLGMPIWTGERVIGAVVVSRTPVSLDKALYDNRSTFAALALLVFLIIGAASALASLAIGRPVRKLLEQVHAIESGAIGESIKSPGTAEFEALSLALERMDKTLKDRNAYIRDFARNVSHEFKTPLTSILGAVELMEEFEEMPLEERRKFLKNISSASQRMQRLVDRLHELAHAQTALLELSQTDVVRVVEEIRYAFNSEGFEVTVVLPMTDEVLVKGSAEMVDTLIRNLVENARQHGAAPVTIRLLATDTEVVIDVSDCGTGVSEGNAEKIFETFFTTSRDRGGTGLGLSIVRSLAQAHGGSLSLSGLGDSTVFRLVLQRVRNV